MLLPFTAKELVFAGILEGDFILKAVASSRFLVELKCPTCCITEPNKEVRPAISALPRPDAFGVRVLLVLLVLLLALLLVLLLLLPA